MKRVRSLLFWCHLAVGVVVAAIVVVMSATGVLLTYQRQITRWADVRGLDGGAPTAGAPRLATERLVALAAGDGEAKPTAITWRAGADAPVEVAFGRERTAFVNAYTGAVLGEGSVGVRKFFRVVTDWHRWLGAAGERRDGGRAITGAANLGFLFLVVSGLWLWWPRNWTRAAVRNVTAFRRGLGGKARDFNWHHVVGFWSAVPLVVVVASGVVISYPWASALVYRAVGEAPPTPTRGGGGGAGGAARGGGGRGAEAPPPLAGVDGMLVVAKQRMPDWRSITLNLSGDPATAVFALDRGSGGQPQHRATLTLDRATGAEVKWEPFAAGSAGRRLRSILRFAHTGEVLGIPGQTVAGLVSAGALLLVWTGIALSLRRLAASLRRRASPTTAPATGSPERRERAA